MDKEQFGKLVAKYISYDKDSGECEREKLIKLASEFGASMPTVIAWASGAANPHLLIRNQVAEYIRKQES